LCYVHAKNGTAILPAAACYMAKLAKKAHRNALHKVMIFGDKERTLIFGFEHFCGK
jgi:hypothetical protein